MSRAETVVNVSASDIENAVAYSKDYNEKSVDINDVVRQVKNIEIGENAVSDGAYSVAVGEFAVTHSNYAIAIGSATANADRSIAIGGSTQVGDDCYDSIAIGNNAYVGDRNTPGVNYAVQLGMGVNLKPNTLQFRDFTVIDENGYLPTDRLKDAIPTKVSELENDSKYTTEVDVDAKIGENVPIKNLDLTSYDINNPIQLSTIGEGAFIVTGNGYIVTNGGHKKIYGKGTELIVVKTNKNGVATLCMTVQDGANFYRIDDDFSTGSDVIRWLSSNNKTTIIDNDNASKIPTSGAVMNYVTEIVNNSIADVSTLIGTVSENEVVE